MSKCSNCKNKVCTSCKLSGWISNLIIPIVLIIALGSILLIKSEKNNNENILNENQKGQWSYYSNESDNNKLYKINKDGTEKIKLNDDEAFKISVAADWIYYLNKSDNDKLYKIKTDGSERTQISIDESGINGGPVNVAGDWIFYSKYYLNRINR